MNTTEYPTQQQKKRVIFAKVREIQKLAMEIEQMLESVEITGMERALHDTYDGIYHMAAIAEKMEKDSACGQAG